MDEFNMVFGFDRAKLQEILQNRMIYNSVDFWHYIAPNTDVYNFSKSKSSETTSSSLRYMC